MREPLSIVARVLLFGVLALGCASSRPIAPVRVENSQVEPADVFGTDQRARLALLHLALAEARRPGSTATDSLLLERPDGLRIRLAFDEAADLDLFVTDPMQESVYFANSPTRSGGTLVEDQRCEDPSPRVEVVHYSDPAPGRYRVGVDFHRRCQDTALSGAEKKEGLYVVRVEERGRVLTREGKVIPGQFEVIVMEFDLE